MNTLTAKKPFFKRPFWIIGILTALFIVPLVGASLMAAEDRPLTHKTTNHGQLITPPYDFSNLDLKNNQSQPIDPKVWRGHWLLLYVNAANCDDNCEKTIFYLHQIRTATGKDSSRVKTAILSFSDLPADTTLDEFLSKHYPTTPHFQTLYNKYILFAGTLPKETLALHHGTIYFVDPHGNMMMAYPNTAQPMDIFKDLTRLLKLSQIG